MNQPISFTLHGVTFITPTLEAASAFYCFDPARPEGDDIGPYGMIEEMKAFMRLTEGMKVFVDVGASFGIFSLVFTDRPGTTAHAIEPSPWAFPVLQKLCELNLERRIMPHPLFIGEENGREVKCGRIWKHVMAHTVADDRTTWPFRETTLDSLNLGQVDCIKIDVEAYECAVLRGAEETIKRWRPLIFLECHFADLYRNGESVESLRAILTGLNYRLEEFSGVPDRSFGHCAMTRVVCRPN